VVPNSGITVSLARLPLLYRGVPRVTSDSTIRVPLLHRGSTVKLHRGTTVESNDSTISYHVIPRWHSELHRGITVE